MANMGTYCKAYTLAALREFDQWKEQSQNAKAVPQPNGDLPAVPRVLTDEDYLFVQENFVVTDGIFIDENIIFDSVTPDWQRFCTEKLGFEVPKFGEIQ
jgi:hypothetical protein